MKKVTKRKPHDLEDNWHRILDRKDKATTLKITARQAIVLAFNSMPDPSGKYQASTLVDRLEEMGIVWTEFKTEKDMYDKDKNRLDKVRRFRANMLANQGKVVIKKEPAGYFSLKPEFIDPSVAKGKKVRDSTVQKV